MCWIAPEERCSLVIVVGVLRYHSVCRLHFVMGCMVERLAELATWSLAGDEMREGNRRRIETPRWFLL